MWGEKEAGSLSCSTTTLLVFTGSCLKSSLSLPSRSHQEATAGAVGATRGLDGSACRVSTTTRAIRMWQV